MSEPALPTAVNAPGAWSSDEDVRGPLAAIGLAFRTTPSGVVDEMESLEMFSVSALDGRATWLRLPDLDIHRPAGDSRFLLTSYALPGERPRHARSDQLVAWDVESGTPRSSRSPPWRWAALALLLAGGGALVVRRRATSAVRRSPA